MSEEEHYDELSFAGQIAFWLLENRMLVIISVGIIALCVTIFVMLIAPDEIYRVQGEIIRIEETGYIVNVVTLNHSVPDDEIIVNPIDISSGICNIDPSFGSANCRLGVKVELTRLGNAFRRWWYLNALIKDYGKEYDYAEE